MRSIAAKRYHKAAPLVLLFLLLACVTTAAAVFNTTSANAETITAEDLEDGRYLFASNCATCHGLDGSGGTGPSLIGVGAAAVDFQVGTGRMPMQMNGPQAPAKPTQFTDKQTRQMAAWVASLGPGPAVPTAEQVDPELGNPAKGMELFRVNCAMCHGSIGGGGALTNGKYAPSLLSTDPVHIYEAMLIGPQNMPVFNEANISPEGKRDIIAYLDAQQQGSPGGLGFGAIGPVAEGFWVWLVGIGVLIGATVWVGVRSS